MWRSIAITTFRRAAASMRRPMPMYATTASTTRFTSANAYAVDRPDGDHDLQDIVCILYHCFSSLLFAYQLIIQTHLHTMLLSFLTLNTCKYYTIQEESSEWAKRTIDVAAVTEDADAITEMHDAVLGKKVFAVDAPDGEHDYEDVVSFSILFYIIFEFRSIVYTLSYNLHIHIYIEYEIQEEHLKGVTNIIDQASVLENPDDVRDEQHRREENHKINPDTQFYNQKY